MERDSSKGVKHRKECLMNSLTTWKGLCFSRYTNTPLIALKKDHASKALKNSLVNSNLQDFWMHLV